MDAATLRATIDGTWPAANYSHVGNWTIRNGAGGGKRVSAASAEAPTDVDDIAEAEAEMDARDQARLFMLCAGEEALDTMLAARGYRIVDPVTLYSAPVQQLTDIPIPRVTAFSIWEPLAIMREIWAKGGIDAPRLDIMARAETKTGILARHADKPAGAGFVAIHGGVAMVHAVEVLDHQRRNGVAGWIMRQAAHWAQANGAHTITALCVEQNAPANALYQRLGFEARTGYHYRIQPEAP